MTVAELLGAYTGGAYITINGVCEEVKPDPWEMLENFDFWNDVKDREVKGWNVIGGEDRATKRELIITLADGV